MVALLLSAVGKTGPVLWSMSGPANQLLRQLGLLLFLAEVGTSAGKNLVATFQESGLLLFGVGAAITVVPMLAAVVVGRLVFKISLLDLLGTITGGMTSTPGLAAAEQPALRQQFRSRGPVDRSVHSPAAEQRAVRGIHNGLDP